MGRHPFFPIERGSIPASRKKGKSNQAFISFHGKFDNGNSKMGSKKSMEREGYAYEKYLKDIIKDGTILKRIKKCIMTKEAIEEIDSLIKEAAKVGWGYDEEVVESIVRGYKNVIIKEERYMENAIRIGMGVGFAGIIGLTLAEKAEGGLIGGVIMIIASSIGIISADKKAKREKEKFIDSFTEEERPLIKAIVAIEDLKRRANEIGVIE